MEASQPTEPTPPSPPIGLTVACGHLAFARYPLLVGHYAGDTFAGTEARLDQVLDGRLTARRRMGLYPGPIGSNTIVRDPNARPPGAVVVGLGEPAGLSAGALRRTLRCGLLAFAARRVDQLASASDVDGADSAICVSALMIGAGEGGLDRTACVQALLQAAAEAQDILARVSKGKASLAAIEIVEVYEDRAVAAYRAAGHALKADPALARIFALPIAYEARQGARSTAAVGPDPTWWQPIQITMSGQARNRRLLFTVSGGLARAEASTIAANLDLVAPLVRRVSRSGTNDDSATSPGRALFELLWPAALKDQSADERPRRLILDERSAGFPWELLDDRRPWMSDEAEREPPAVRAGMVRQLVQTRFREDVVATPGPLKALVVGNPGGASTGMGDLPKAEEEAKAIAAALGGPPYATLLAGAAAGPEEITRRLFTDAWEIIHMSAHGASNQMVAGPDGKKSKRTGIVLGGGAVLDASALAKIPVAPGIVFLNCCHLGVGSINLEGRPEFAANVAVALIRLGVRCVIAAGWAIDDDVASVFGETFYREMLAGRTFGGATLEARKAAYRVNPMSSTFGAYQCYGDPDYRLRIDNARADPKTGQDYIAVSEVIEAVTRVRDDLNIGLERKLDTLNGRLAALETAAQRWPGRADLHVVLAEAWGELGDFGKAIDHYAAAVRSPDAAFKVRVVEQLANLSARQAVACMRALPADQRNPSKTAEVIRTSLRKIEGLSALLGETRERLSLQASCWKRLAQIQPAGGDADAALAKMAELYDRATALDEPTDNAYPRLMACVARVCAAVRTGNECDPDIAAELQALTDAKPPEDADFWRLVQWADARMADTILQSANPEGERQALLAAYARAWRHVGSPAKLKSVIEQMEFYEDIFSAGSPSTEDRRTSARVLAETLRSAVEAARLGACPAPAGDRSECE